MSLLLWVLLALIVLSLAGGIINFRKRTHLARKLALKLYEQISYEWAAKFKGGNEGEESHRWNMHYHRVWDLLTMLYWGKIPAHVINEMREMHRRQTEGGLRFRNHISLDNSSKLPGRMNVFPMDAAALAYRDNSSPEADMLRDMMKEANGNPEGIDYKKAE